MNLYIPFAITEQDLTCPMEMFAAIPYCNDVAYLQVAKHFGWWNDGVFSKLFLNTPKHTRVSKIKDCDIVVIPYKYKKDDKRVEDICNIANKKTVIQFFCDDSSEQFDVPDNLILFRTSLNKSNRLDSERAMPVLVPDHNTVTSLSTSLDNTTITYCGHLLHGRDKQLHHLKRIYNNHYIVPRHGFWAPEMNKLHARKEYYKILESGGITFCSRGGGNFSYRFYEALSFGRIPLLINTDCELPFEQNGIIDWNNHIIRINEKDFLNMDAATFENKIEEGRSKISPKGNRELWETMLSPVGYFNNFYKDI